MLLNIHIYFLKKIIERLLTFGSTKLLLNHVLQLPLITVVAPKLLESFKSAQISELHRQLCPGNNHKKGCFCLFVLFLTPSTSCQTQTSDLFWVTGNTAAVS